MIPEAFSIAMTIHHFRSQHPGSSRARIVKTDINPDLLKIADIGEYGSETLEQTPAIFSG